MTHILLLIVMVCFITSKTLMVHSNQKSVKNLSCPDVPSAKPRWYVINKELKVKALYNNQGFQIHLIHLSDQVVCVKIQLEKEGQNDENYQVISVKDFSAIANFKPDFINFTEQYTLEFTLLMEKHGEYFWSQKYRYKNIKIAEPMSVHCKNKEELLEITLRHLNERAAVYEVFITKDDPSLITLCNQTVLMKHNESNVAQVLFHNSCFQCNHTYKVMVKALLPNEAYRVSFLYVPCDRAISSEFQAKQNLCRDLENKTSVLPVSFINTTSQPDWYTSIQPQTSNSQSSAIWIVILILILVFITCLFLILQRSRRSKYSQCTYVNQDMAKQQGLIISFPQPMEHCAATKELTIILNSYTSLHVRSSHEMKLKENQSLKKQIQQVYDNFNTFIIIHSDGLYYHNQNQETNGIGYEMADFTIELVKFCTRDGLYQSKNIYHVTFDEDSSKFEYSELCSGPQDNMYYLYRPNVLGNNGLDLNQIENLFCDINDQQAVIQPSRYHVKFQMNWKESREIQNLNDALVFRDDRQRMFPHWYTDMFPRSEINENLPNFNLDKISKMTQIENGYVRKSSLNLDFQSNNLFLETYTQPDNISEINSDQISEFLEKINYNHI